MLSHFSPLTFQFQIPSKLRKKTAITEETKQYSKKKNFAESTKKKVRSKQK